MSVRFATCNILFDDGKSEPRWNERSKNLVSLIEELKPDVLATQEGRKDQLLELRDLIANNYKLLDDHREWDSIKMYPCIFVKKDTIKCLESHDRWLSETPLIKHSKSFESRWPKLATIAKLVKEDTTFTTASFHFDNVTSTARPKQAHVLLEQCKMIAQNTTTVVMGDANDDPGSETIKVLKDNGFQDPFNWSDTPITFHGFHKKDYDCRIDFILHNDKSSTVQCFTDFRRSDYYSDHFMVIADIELN